jgi:hypothetical protein
MSIANDKNCFPFLVDLKKNLSTEGIYSVSHKQKTFWVYPRTFWLLYHIQNAGGATFLKSSGFLNFPVRVIFSLWFT